MTHFWGISAGLTAGVFLTLIVQRSWARVLGELLSRGDT